jgi:endonuclease/exonuclease/phosphatase family metal-dependent hydrolase
MRLQSKLIHFGVALAIAALSVGCTDDETESGLALLTYNAALTDLFAEYAGERAPFVATALRDEAAATAFDAMCLQEVWNDDDVDAIRRATADSLPTSMVLERQPEVQPSACDPDTLPPLEMCVRAACTDPPTADCILNSCGADYAAQSGSCRVCLAGQVGTNLVDDIIAGCTMENAIYQYDGGYGLMMLSGAAVLAQDQLELTSTLNRRAVMYMQLDTADGPLHAFCTHLASVYDDIPYPLDEGSWEQEQQAQLDALLAFVEAKAGSDGKVAVLGDLNVSPDGAQHVGEQEATYQRLIDAGLTNPYVDGNEACTFCGDNPLLDADEPSVVLDHVLLRNVAGGTTAARVFDDPIALDVNGMAVQSARSDHYGVRVLVE